MGFDQFDHPQMLTCGKGWGLILGLSHDWLAFLYLRATSKNMGAIVIVMVVGKQLVWGLKKFRASKKNLWVYEWKDDSEAYQ